MSAGLPGLGLGGLFFIFSALLAPFRELWRTLRGRTRPGEWRVVGRQFAQAVTMVVAIDLTLRLTYVLLSLVGVGDVPSAVSGTVLPLTLIGITTALLLVVLAAAKLAELRFRLRGAALPRIPQTLPRPTPVRALAYGGAAAIAWVALLSAGASELSPLSRPPAAPVTVERPAEEGRPSPVPARASGVEAAPVIAAARFAPEARQDGVEAEPQSEGAHRQDGAQPSAPAPSPTAISAPAEVHAPAPSQAGGGRGTGPQGKAAQPAAPSSPGRSESAGPPEGSNAPESAGPPEGSNPSESAGPPEGSPAPEHAGPERP